MSAQNSEASPMPADPSAATETASAPPVLPPIPEADFGWWGLYAAESRRRPHAVVPVKILAADDTGVCVRAVEEGEEEEEEEAVEAPMVTATQDEEEEGGETTGGWFARASVQPVWKVLAGCRVCDTHLEFRDGDGDHFALVPEFESNTVAYSFNGVRRTGFRAVAVDVEGGRAQLTFSKPSATRAVPLPPWYRPLLLPLRRLLEACGVEHGLGKEEPDVVGPWRRHPIPDGSGLHYWRNAAAKLASLNGPTPDEVLAAARCRADAAAAASSSSSPQRPPGAASSAAQALQENLVSAGLREVRVAADGHCQFRSVAFHLHGTPTEHERVRREIAAHMAANAELYAPFCSEDSYEEYCARMGDCAAVPPAWGDGLTLQAAASTYNLCFHVVTSRERRNKVRPSDFYTPEEERAAPRDVYLAYSEDEAAMHYNPVVVEADGGEVGGKAKEGVDGGCVAE